MFARVHKASETKGGNKGSCTDLASYLDKGKDNDLKFFSHSENDISVHNVINSIDNNKFKLSKEDAKFYMLTLNPSERELQHLIGKDINNLDDLPESERKELFKKIEDFTKDAMDKYALNFDRPTVQSGDDLMYFARIETERLYKKTDEEVKEGVRKIGEKKEGLQVHVHVIVSRKSKDGKVKLSPNAKSAGNQWDLKDRGEVKRGFSHDKWKGEVQAAFNENFKYKPLAKEEYKSKVIPKEVVLEKVNNADLKKILENHTFTSTNQVDYLMKQNGYDTKVFRGTHVFKKENETFSIKNNELKPFVQRVPDEKMKDILQRFNLIRLDREGEKYNDKGITVEKCSFKDKKSEKEISYFVIHDSETKVSISLSRLTNFAYDNKIRLFDRNLHLDAIDNPDLKDVLSNKDIKTLEQVEIEMTKRGYKCVSHDDRTTFLKDSEGYSITNKHLSRIIYEPAERKESNKSAITSNIQNQALNHVEHKVKNKVVKELTSGEYNEEIQVARNTKKIANFIVNQKDGKGVGRIIKNKVVKELTGDMFNAEVKIAKKATRVAKIIMNPKAAVLDEIKKIFLKDNVTE